MIDRHHLRYFLAVVDAGNFSRAAAAMNVAQPTLSVGIAKLEAALGASLFHRSSRHVHLTESGTRLLASARRIETEFNIAESDLAARPHGTRLRLGILSTLSTALVERVIAARCEQERDLAGPGDELEVIEGGERDLLARLDRERLDAALTIIRPGAGRLAAETLFREPYLLVLPEQHRLASRSSIAAEELAAETMIVRRHCEALSEISKHFIARGVRPRLSLKTTNDDLALAMVRAGLGITVMPEGTRLPGICRPSLSGFAAAREIGLLFPRKTDPARIGRSVTIETIRSLLRAPG